jgi:hypothetical protein
MLLGGAVFVIGVVLRFAPGLLAWFGHLPGDIRLEGENSRVYIPITSTIVASVVLTVLLNVAAVLLRDR